MNILKKFVENQTTLLNQLSDVLGPEAKPAGAQK